MYSLCIDGSIISIILDIVPSNLTITRLSISVCKYAPRTSAVETSRSSLVSIIDARKTDSMAMVREVASYLILCRC